MPKCRTCLRAESIGPEGTCAQCRARQTAIDSADSDLAASGKRRYVYHWIGAHMAGVGARLPSDVIRELAPDACAFEPKPLTDCTMFWASPLAELPEYIREVQ